MSLFGKIKTKLSNRPNEKSFTQTSLSTRVEQLERIRDMNETMEVICNQISHRFYDEKSEICHFTIEQIAATMQMTSMATAPKSPQYSQWLRDQMILLDQVGREQRRFHFNIQDKVIIPLREWRHGDYCFMRDELMRLERYKKVMRKNKFNEMNLNDIVNKERVQMEHDKQLLQVINQLNNLDRIQHSHMSVLCDLMCIIVEYGRAVENIIAPCKENEAVVFA